MELLTLLRGNASVRLVYNFGHAPQVEFQWKQCNTLAKLLCSIYKIQKISQILLEIGCNAKKHHMCGQVIATRCDL